MNFQTLLTLVGDEPVFETSFLLAGNASPAQIRLQLNRWINRGKVIQWRRGVYSLAPPYQKETPHPFVIANHLQPASYVSGQSALSFYGLIPDIAQTVISVGSGRSEHITNPLGRFIFRHIKPAGVFGYTLAPVTALQKATIAEPEKALLDLLYLQPGSDSLPFLNELRLQNIDGLDTSRLSSMADRFQSPKMQRAADLLLTIIENEKGGHVSL
jgi:predicted transcriptional regulator of viral defense system